MKIKLTKEQKIQVKDSKDVYGIMRKILLRENKYNQEKEHFWVVGLDKDNRIIFIELISLGNFTAATVDPNDVFWLATNKITAGVILVHNHSGENLEPSDSDIEITDRLIQSAFILRTQVLDHLIISPTDYYSFVVTGLFETLLHSEKFKPKYTEIDRLRKIYFEKGIENGKEQGIEIGEFNKAIAMAQGMLLKGIKIDDIAEISGLTKAQITSLAE